ncbi:MAG: ATP-dependent DNA helicase RecQ [Cyanobacteria bacterium J149]|nr:MAG: ATP-dependent DNA helicase RecQ [Cyanobacteria bacterium J149]
MRDYSLKAIRHKFRQIWGYESFRKPQGEIILTLLQQRDALIVMPTGGGKSLCFQLPAILQTGLTLVISPLVALIENQVQEIQQLGLAGASLHSQMPKYQKKRVLKQIENQELRLLYLSPESLLSQSVWQKISQPQIKLNGLIIDEVHCLVHWGESLRPAYRRLGAVRQALLKNKPPASKIPLAAFTATAHPQAQATIIRTLQLINPAKFILSPYRPNLNLKVKTIWTPKSRKNQALKFISRQKKASGLVYVRSRSDSVNLANWLQTFNYSVAEYHAGLPIANKRKVERDWLKGKIQFVVCTSAFGMGINKSNVSWILHWQTPLILPEYLQEIGRGGRDGKPTTILALVSEPTGWFNGEDRRKKQFFRRQLVNFSQKVAQIAKKIPAHGTVQQVKEQFEQGEASLSLLHSLGDLQWLDPFSYQKLNKYQKNSFTKILENNILLEREMQNYLCTKQCRWQFLLAAFGFSSRQLCHHCDNCLKKN